MSIVEIQPVTQNLAAVVWWWQHEISSKRSISLNGHRPPTSDLSLEAEGNGARSWNDRNSRDVTGQRGENPFPYKLQCRKCITPTSYRLCLQQVGLLSETRCRQVGEQWARDWTDLQKALEIPTLCHMAGRSVDEKGSETFAYCSAVIVSSVDVDEVYFHFEPSKR